MKNRSALYWPAAVIVSLGLVAIAVWELLSDANPATMSLRAVTIASLICWLGFVWAWGVVAHARSHIRFPRAAIALGLLALAVLMVWEAALEHAIDDGRATSHVFRAGGAAVVLCIIVSACISSANQPVRQQ